eukprot:TRINITY_DN3131_c0_g1_i1.p1 TRINITY_DN3131_c0_g1~~TRINITY_DN3131_c0_g1_i1.p1  ORF type:complete len:113 (+),score=18.11 TRINITY_DN3131_c0_g1_i1:33-341(+)
MEHPYKRPEAERKYTKPQFNTEDLPPDWIALISLILGIVGMMFRYKIAAWISVFFCLGALVNVKYSEADLKQFLSCIAFSTVGLVINYFAPTPKPPGAEATQ